ncbi:MAG: hypothetical protein M3463_01640, partial [Verrucomicrobiota bacterium]|nr:hypothetical protein [Verrucomicrobiota bacterium]
SVHSKCLWSWVVVLVNTTSKPSTEAHFELFFASGRKNHACLGTSFIDPESKARFPGFPWNAVFPRCLPERFPERRLVCSIHS